MHDIDFYLTGIVFLSGRKVAKTHLGCDQNVPSWTVILYNPNNGILLSCCCLYVPRRGIQLTVTYYFKSLNQPSRCHCSVFSR